MIQWRSAVVRVSMFPVVLCGGLLVGCGDSGVGEIKVGGVEDSGGVFEDEDGDGFGVDDGDCDDRNALVSPVFQGVLIMLGYRRQAYSL